MISLSSTISSFGDVLLSLLATNTGVRKISVNDGTFWMPPDEANFGNNVDVPFYFIYWVCVVCFVGIVGVMCWFMWKYRRVEEGTAPPETHAAPTHNTPLEITWSAIPLVIVIVMFYIGFRGAMDMTNPPEGARKINVIAGQWSWSFGYHTGLNHPELHVPANEPIQLVMTSRDVLHSLFVPAFRVKQDVVPAKYSTLWFIANMEPDETQPKEYDLFCTEYCGRDHSKMTTKVVVYPTIEMWEEKLAELGDLAQYPAPVAGDLIYRRFGGCNSCHSDDGTRITGPTFKGIWGRTVNGETQFDDGTSLAQLLDAPAEQGGYGGQPLNYFTESIWFPAEKVVAGYPNQMNTFRGQIDEQQIQYLVSYVKWLEDNDGSPLEIFEGMEQSVRDAGELTEQDEIRQQAVQDFNQQFGITSAPAEEEEGATGEGNAAEDEAEGGEG